jgi:hypothetical protein
MQSTLWTASTGDLTKSLGGLTPEEAERVKSVVAGKSEDEIRRGLIGWAHAMRDYKITQKEAVSADEVHLHIHATPSVEALRSGKAVIVMKRIGNEWKKAGDVN